MNKFKSRLSSVKSFFKGFTAKDAVLSFQHMFAMLGATITVPLVVGMSIPLALFSAGVGTIIFFFLTQRKVPVFLGSSFAFMPGLITIFSQFGKDPNQTQYNTMALTAMLALVAAGLVYVVFSFLIKKVGVKKVKKLFPPIVVGPVIIIIGMNLAGSIFWNDIVANYVVYGSVAWKQWTTALITALTIILINAFARPKSFMKIIPILFGFVVGYAYSAIIGLVHIDFSNDVIIFQQAKQVWGFWGAWNGLTGALIGTAMLSIVPIALVTFMEHLGDISANSVVCGKDFMVDPGLHRTVLGDGVATVVSGMLGGPANTTYGENTAVLAITGNYSPRNVFVAACYAVLLGLIVPFGEILSSIPSAVVGGACIVLFGMISANGLRALVDGKVDFGDSKNMLVVSVTLSVGLGLGAVSLGGDIVSAMSNYGINGNLVKVGFGTDVGGFVEVSALAISTVLAVVLNLIIPNKKLVTEEEMEASDKASVSLVANVMDEDVLEHRDSPEEVAEKTAKAKNIEE
ncbi:MAG: solute carrier family 23 protein [Clostridia bacterium]